MVKVSVVVPVYNSELYLDECISSLINQTLREIEFIFVDDGSMDNSVEIIKKYQSEDDRIILLQQENQYAGVARNNGMKKATGKYIIFLDSDDFFELNMLEELFHCAEKYQTEILMFGYYTFDDKTHECNAELLEPYGNYPNTVFSKIDLGERIFQCSPAPWTKLFLKDFIVDQQLYFQAIPKCNDTFFNRIAVALSERMFFLRKRYVYYRVNNDSSLQGSKNSHLECYPLAGMKIVNELKKRKIYFGSLKKACDNEMFNLIHFGIDGATESIYLSHYYYFLKEHLIPDLFNCSDDLNENETVLNVFISQSYEEFLFLEEKSMRKKLIVLDEIYATKERFESKNNILNAQLFALQSQYDVMRSSKDYKFGKSILYLPKKIKKLIW